MTKPRIGINLLWLLPEHAGGAEEYAIRVLRALDQMAPDGSEITLLCNRRFPSAYPELSDRFETAIAPIDGASRPLRIGMESTWLVREAARARLHLVHHLNNVVPWIRNRPSVLTIHDLRPLVMPGTLGKTQGAYLRSRLGPSVRHSAVITTPSAFVRQTVIDLLDADPARVQVVSAPLFPPAPSPVDGSGDAGVEGRFFIYPAITNIHKNHGTLLKAFAKVVAARADALLVLTGADGSAEGAVADSIARLGLGDNVLRLGRVPAARLDTLVKGAVALVYPSTYEGFGLPLAEAMAAGCPVIASDRSALPEVLGDAGILLDPDDVDGWADAMLRSLEDETLRATLIAAGRERVRALTPDETARRLIGAYRFALDQGSGR
ncbi:MAG: glycosyltransferase family 1 protein [Actinomycetota bacterium]